MAHGDVPIDLQPNTDRMQSIKAETNGCCHAHAHICLDVIKSHSIVNVVKNVFDTKYGNKCARYNLYLSCDGNIYLHKFSHCPHKRFEKLLFDWNVSRRSLIM